MSLNSGITLSTTYVFAKPPDLTLISQPSLPPAAVRPTPQPSSSVQFRWSCHHTPYDEDSQPEAILGPLPIHTHTHTSGDIAVCHSWRLGWGQDTTKHPTRHRTTPPQRIPKVSGETHSLAHEKEIDTELAMNLIILSSIAADSMIFITSSICTRADRTIFGGK